MITKGRILLPLYKVSTDFLGIVWRSVWRICFLILGLNGLFAMELEKLLVNDNIGTSCQKDVSQALYQTLQRTNWALKTVRLTSFQKPQLEFVSIFFKLVHLFVFFVLPLFVFALLFVLSFDVLSCYFYVSLSLVAVPTGWILEKKFRDTVRSLKSASIPWFVLLDTFPPAFTSLVRLSPYSSLRHRRN